VPQRCRYRGCSGTHFRHHQAVEKQLRDTVYRHVTVHRYQCLRCGRTFRVYPPGVGQAPTSLRVKGLAVLLYVLGLSYGAVSLTREALGCYMRKSRVYDAVQAAAERVPGLRQEKVFQGIRTPALGGDVTSVRCNGRWLPLGLTVDDLSGTVLTIDALRGEDAETLRAWLEPIAGAVGAELLISDDADSFKAVVSAKGGPGRSGIGASGLQEPRPAAHGGVDPEPTTRRGRGQGQLSKERYRTMRGYKRQESAVNVSRLLPWCGDHRERGGARLAPLIA